MQNIFTKGEKVTGQNQKADELKVFTCVVACTVSGTFQIRELFLNVWVSGYLVYDVGTSQVENRCAEI